MNFDKEIVAATIKNLRKKKEISQEILSGLSGICRSHLAMIENGTKQPNFETIWKIAVGLNMNPSALVAEMEKAIMMKSSDKIYPK